MTSFTVDPRVLLRELARPVNGHAAIVSRFITASELAQGLADATFAGTDARNALSDTALRVCVALARQLENSWRGVSVEPVSLTELAALPLPDAITYRRSEGYAARALYPEMYLDAARCAPTRDRRVIGTGSWGAGLAALVAVGGGAPLPAIVLSPVVDVAPELLAEWLGGEMIALVGEGPGGGLDAVADLLEDHGVTTLEVFPGRDGELAATASARHRDRWRRLPRYHAEFDAAIRPRIVRWIAEVVGRVIGVEDLSRGAWRALRYSSDADWPACVLDEERRKLLVHTLRGSFLARFVGLGTTGEQALHRARTLHAAGFTPEPAGLVHGFLVERWQDLVRPLASFDRRLLVERIGEYLAFRATAFRGGSGADINGLRALAHRHADLEVAPPASSPRRIEIDGRLHAHEWLVTPGGLLKADAYDGVAELGAQDVAWDVAGAIAELALTPAEEARVAAACDVDREQLALAKPCYLAFQLARHALAVDRSPPDEQPRLRAEVTRYRGLAARLRA